MAFLRTAVATGFLAFFAGSALAGTVSVNIKDPSQYGTLTSGWNSVGQDFEALGANGGRREVGGIGTPLVTNVGSFQTIGGTGSGGTVKDPGNNTTPTNTGKQLALRDGTVYGRKNVVPTPGSWFLDSNDTHGMKWDVSLGGTLFNKLIFALTDATDVGAFLRIIVNGEVETVLNKNVYTNGTTKLVMVDFGEAVKSATIILGNYAFASAPTCVTTARMNCTDKPFINDGFSIDGIQVSAVPLPAGILLLGTALAGFGAMKRRRKA